MTAKPTIFISHIQEDYPIASRIGDWIRSNFSAAVNTFIASDNLRGLAGGDDWWPNIGKHLKTCKIVLVILTKRALNRPWIYFESGGGYFLGKITIPLIMDIDIKTDFKPPLSQLQAYTLNDPNSLNKLLQKINLEFSLEAINRDEGIIGELLQLNANVELEARKKLEREIEEEKLKRRNEFKDKCLGAILRTIKPIGNTKIIPNSPIIELRTVKFTYLLILNLSDTRRTILKKAMILQNYKKNNENLYKGKNIRLVYVCESDKHRSDGGRTTSTVKGKEVIVLKYDMKNNIFLNLNALLDNS